MEPLNDLFISWSLREPGNDAVSLPVLFSGHRTGNDCSDMWWKIYYCVLIFILAMCMGHVLWMILSSCVSNTNGQNMLRFLESTTLRDLVSIIPVLMHVYRNTTACYFYFLFFVDLICCHDTESGCFMFSSLSFGMLMLAFLGSICLCKPI